MTRLFVLTFLGKPRSDHAGHAHESPAVMVIPLMVLALASAVGGVINLPHLQWLAGRFHELVHHPELREGVSPSMEYVLMGVSTVGALLGVGLGWMVYRKISAKSLSKNPPVLENKWYIDEIYEAAIVKPLVAFSKQLWKIFDVGIIDRLVVGTGRMSALAGSTLRVVQNGSLQVYAVTTVLGLLASVGYLLYVMGH
jgi:NADH-quinone oxidoreductase subunit L